jgi:hypothetical protein
MTAAFGVQAKEAAKKGGRTALARRTIPPKKKEEKSLNMRQTLWSITL